MDNNIDIDDLSEEEILEYCVKDELKLKDRSGMIFWVDSFDQNGMYVHSDEGDTHRISRARYHEFEPVKA
jgi:hypothetical protein